MYITSSYSISFITYGQQQCCSYTRRMTCVIITILFIEYNRIVFILF